MAKKKTAKGDALARRLRELGLARYPGAHLKSPWPGHLDLAVKDKTFAYLSVDGEPFSISCKLPDSNAVALMLPNTKPTAYGLGKSGWVSASYEDDELPPAEIFEAWIDESYRAQAPKKLVAQLDAGGAAAPAGPAKRAAARNAAPKNAAPKKAAPKNAAPKKAAPKKAAPKKAAAKKAAAKKAAAKKAAAKKAAAKKAAAKKAAARKAPAKKAAAKKAPAKSSAGERAR